MVVTKQDEMICQCNDVTTGEFSNVVGSSPAMTFEKALKVTGAASKCTACLLDLELVYQKSSQERSYEYKDGVLAFSDKKRKQRRRPARFIRECLDILLPKINPVVNSYLVVVYGKCCDPYLSVSNDELLYTDKYPICDAEVSVVLRANDGCIVGRLNFAVKAASSTRISLKKYYDKVNLEDYCFGYCELSVRFFGNG